MNRCQHELTSNNTISTISQVVEKSYIRLFNIVGDIAGLVTSIQWRTNPSNGYTSPGKLDMVLECQISLIVPSAMTYNVCCNWHTFKDEYRYR